jgi:hypothetical protein
MKTWMKWMLGIVIAGIIVACIAAVAFFAIDRLQRPVASFGIRTGRLWDEEMELRLRDMDELPFFDREKMPYHDLDEMPFYRMPRDRFYSNTFPLRLIWLPLLCLGSLSALGLGAVALIVLLTRKSRGASPPASPPPAPPAVPSPLAACAHCGKPAHPEWSHCPYCGAELVEAVSQADESGQEAGS